MSRQTTNRATGMRKREQIEAANKTVFLWTMLGASALALCAVLGYFLIKEIAFNTKIIAEKSNTLSTLHSNIEAAEQLEGNIKALIANNDLASVKANESDSNYKVVLDALPVTADSTVLGSSLLQVLLDGSGVRTQVLTTSLGIGEEGMIEEGVVMPDPVAGAPIISPVGFEYTALGNYSQVSRMLKDLELSIRPINVKRLSIQGSDDSLQTTVEGESYYSSKRTVELGTKQVTP